MHLCLLGQRHLGHTYWHQSSDIQTMYSEAFLFSSAGTYVTSLMRSVCSSEAEDILWVFDATDPMDYGTVIAAESLQCCGSVLYIVYSILYLAPRFATMEPSLAERTQAPYTLPRILDERCLMIRTGKSFLNFPQATQHLVSMALLHLLQSQFGHRLAETDPSTWDRHSLSLQPVA